MTRAFDSKSFRDAASSFNASATTLCFDPPMSGPWCVLVGVDLREDRRRLAHTIDVDKKPRGDEHRSKHPGMTVALAAYRSVIVWTNAAHQSETKRDLSRLHRPPAQQSRCRSFERCPRVCTAAANDTFGGRAWRLPWIGEWSAPVSSRAVLVAHPLERVAGHVKQSPGVGCPKSHRMRR